MSLSPRMIVTRVARQVASNATSTSSSAASASTTKVKNRVDTSGLTPIEVALTLAILLGVFILLIIIGELCKVFNKPKAKALPYVSGQKQKLFQPSAAGYGTRVAASHPPEENAQYSSRVSLMAAASPMGRGGRMDDSGDVSFGTPGSNNSTDYFGKGGHSRGQSSGIKLPGATAATSRKGAAAHPFLPGALVAPDGSGFQVGQMMNHHNTGSGPSGYASRPAGMSPSERTPGPRATSNVGMGSPPASDAKRRSRYARADGRRVDSVGPGTIRKSMYLGSDGQAVEGMPRSASNNNLRRVDSVGRGDHRRKSTFVTDQSRENRGQSIYNADGGSTGKGGPVKDPLAARRPMMPVNGGSNSGYKPQSRGIGSQQGYQQQQPIPQQYQQQQQPLMNMPPMQRQVSPVPSQIGAGGPMLSRPMQPIRGHSGMSAGGYGPPNPGGYDMKTRQVV